MIVDRCRLCGGRDVQVVVDLGFHPCADTFLYPEQLRDMEPHYPLQVALCLGCGHAMTTCVVPATDRYQKYDYSYDSANSPVAVDHWRDLAADVCKRYPLSSQDLVVDIGSNIGTLLHEFKSLGGTRVLGVDPAPNMATLAERNGVPTINDFFNASSAAEIRRVGAPKVITATNCLNHAENVDEFVAEVAALLPDDGVFVLEVPYLLDLVRQTAFDTIYLEHVNYFSVTPLVGYLNHRGLTVQCVETQEYMCGSIRLFIRKSGSSDASVKRLMEREATERIRSVETYERLMARIRRLKRDLNQRLYAVKAAGGKIVGIGAATKGNTLLNYCKIDSDLLDYVTDNSRYKVGKLTPGMHIAIRDDSAISPDITHGLVLPWNIAPYLVQKLKHLKIQFVVPRVEQ
jgi:SAM-dependent methyltransferase